MTETTTLTGAQSADTGERGRLDISAKAIERIATHAAQSVPGVVASGSGLDRIVGRGLPRANSTVAGDTVRLSLDIGLTWPVAAGEVARAVRAEVTRQVGSMTGLSVAAVDVSVAKFAAWSPASTGRVQ